MSKKDSFLMKINSFSVDPDKLFLRSSNNGKSYGGFKRKPVGQWNVSKNWTGIANCEECGGFFGIDKKFNRFGIMPRNTIELCEWRGTCIPIDNDKICVSEYQVIATNGAIPDEYFKEYGFNILRSGEHIKEIASGRWIIFGGTIDKITGGHQSFSDRSSAGESKISGGHQSFWGKSSAGESKITGGDQYFSDRSSAGKAKITGGDQYFSDRSSAGKAKITGGDQYFSDRSSAGESKISGGHQSFSNRSSAGKAKISGGHQSFSDRS